RVIAATHRNLRERVHAGQFREDLLYRLEVVAVELPALRHRRNDLPLLIEHFLHEAKRRHPTSPVKQLGADVMKRLPEHRWPGNVRELEHTIERMVLLGRSAEVSAAELPTSVMSTPPRSGMSFDGEVIPMRELQRRYAQWAYDRL